MNVDNNNKNLLIFWDVPASVHVRPFHRNPVMASTQLIQTEANQLQSWTIFGRWQVSRMKTFVCLNYMTFKSIVSLCGLLNIHRHWTATIKKATLGGKTLICSIRRSVGGLNEAILWCDSWTTVVLHHLVVGTITSKMGDNFSGYLIGSEKEGSSKDL